MIEFAKLKPYVNPFLAVTSASLATVSNGMEVGWPSPAIPVLFSNNTPISPPPDLENLIYVSNLITTLYVVSGIGGIIQSFLLLTYFGRRITIFIVIIVDIICWVLIACANRLEQIYVARFISGIAETAIFVAIPMYNGECSQPEIRGLLGSTVYILSMSGVVVVYVIVPFMPIWTSSMVPICLNIIALITFSYHPESPYYLLKISKIEQAEKSLRHFRSRDDVEEEFAQITAAVARQEAEQGKVWDLFRIRSNRKATLYMFLLSSTQNMAGLSVILMNVHFIFKEAIKLTKDQPPISEDWLAIIFSVVFLIAGILGAALMDKCGRKCLVISSAFCTSMFLIFLVMLNSVPHLFSSMNILWLTLIALIGYAFAFKYGIGLVPIVVNGEIFSSSVKVSGMLMSDVYFTIAAAISMQMYYLTVKSLKMYVSFLIFALYSAMAAILVWIFVPETKGKTLEEIQMILKQ